MAEEILGRWWNGKWGRIALRRVLLDRTDDGYRVTAREGPDDAPSSERVWMLPTEEQGRQLVDSLIEVDPADPLSARWKELPPGLFRHRSEQAAEDR